MYQALYRKYRPRRFSDVTGQEHITETLCGQIKTERTTHAYLFVGTRGTGKTTCAKILSRAVNCLSPADGNPCNECSSCTGIENGTILDVLELDAASNNGVDDVRALRDEAVYSPAAVKKRVYIIDEVHMLSTPAFNALLKILEEPPEHILFILATTELHKVPATILSRCQRFSFKRLSVSEISSRLGEIAASEGLTLKPEAVSMLAGLADGSMRDAISLLDQCVSDKPIDPEYVRETLGLAASDDLMQLISAIAEYDTIKLLDILDRLYKEGKDMGALLGEISAVLRDLLVVRLAPDAALISGSISAGDLGALSGMFTPERLFYCLDVSKNVLLGMSRTGISKLIMEMCLIRMSDERLADDTAALASRISRLEAAGAGTADAAPVKRSEPESKPVKLPAIAPAELPNASATEPLPSEPKPAGLPDEPSAPKTVASPDDALTAILNYITDNSLRVMLNDSNKAQANMADGVLVINMSDEFSAEIIKNTFIGTLKEAASKVFKKETQVRVETQQSGAVEDRQSKLDDLLAFDIVKTEGDGNNGEE